MPQPNQRSTITTNSSSSSSSSALQPDAYNSSAEVVSIRLATLDPSFSCPSGQLEPSGSGTPHLLWLVVARSDGAVQCFPFNSDLNPEVRPLMMPTSH